MGPAVLTCGDRRRAGRPVLFRPQLVDAPGLVTPGGSGDTECRPVPRQPIERRFSRRRLRLVVALATLGASRSGPEAIATRRRRQLAPANAPRLLDLVGVAGDPLGASAGRSSRDVACLTGHGGDGFRTFTNLRPLPLSARSPRVFRCCRAGRHQVPRSSPLGHYGRQGFWVGAGGRHVGALRLSACKRTPRPLAGRGRGFPFDLCPRCGACAASVCSRRASPIVAGARGTLAACGF